jgi:hypothetical protein
MGGFGSGWHDRREDARPRVEETCSVAPRDVAWQLHLDPRETGQTVHVVLLEDTDQSIVIEAVPARFGGFRWWWRCPACFKRRGSLYHRQRRWACRVCHQLSYTSQQVSRPPSPLARWLDAVVD